MSSESLVDYRILGKHMKDARERLGKTQYAVANDLNIIVSTYGKFERGVLKPNLERLIAICLTLNISIEDCLRGALKAEIVSSNAPPSNDRYLGEFQNLIDQCRHPKIIQTMLTICHQIAMLENSK